MRSFNMKIYSKKKIDNFDVYHDCEIIMHCSPKINWIHFEYEIIKDGKSLGFKYSDANTYNGWGLNEGSFRYGSIAEYIYTEDKKEDLCGNGVFTPCPKIEDLYNLITEDGLLLKFYGRFYNGSGEGGGYCTIKSYKAYPARFCSMCACFMGVVEQLDNVLFKFALCQNCKKLRKESKFKSPVFGSRLPATITEVCFKQKNPRSFLKDLFLKKKKPSKTFFQKYIKKHLNKVKKVRSISSSELFFFRSWLGVKELTKIAQ